MIPVMMRFWMPQQECNDWVLDLDDDIANLPAYTQYTSFADFSHNNNGLRLQTGNDGQTSFVSFDDCPVVTDFEFEFAARLDSTFGNGYSGFVGWRDDDPEGGTETGMNFSMQWSYSLAPGFITLFYNGGIGGFVDQVQLFEPTIASGTTYRFKIRHVGQSIKVWFDDALIYDCSNTNSGTASRIYLGNKNLSVLANGYTTFEWVRLCILD